MLNDLQEKLPLIEIREYWINKFWRYPHRLFALKTAIAMGSLLIPFVFLSRPFIGVVLALGVLAGALAETDDHPKGRAKALLLTILSFACTSTSVQLLHPYPIPFAIGLALSTIILMILGGLAERYRRITFSALLISIYTLIGVDQSPVWYWQPMLLTSGALCFGGLSLLLQVFRPWRLLEEQLSQGFEDLSLYIKEKSKLFPSGEQAQEKIRNRLAGFNIQVITSIERCKGVLNNYADAIKDQKSLSPYRHKFLLLQSLHERASSSHARYELLSSDPENAELLEGIGQLLIQLSRACHEVSKSLVIGTPYQHPASIKWTISALEEQQKRQLAAGKRNNLSLLLQNLNQSHISLQNMDYYVETGLLPEFERIKPNLKKRLLDQLNWNHPRMRYAIRLSLCFLLGYLLMQYFKLNQGEWVLLTSLFVCQQSYTETRRRLFQRILGTIIGVLAGILLVQLLPTATGLMLLLIVSSYAFFIWLRSHYSVSVIFITIFVLAAYNLMSGIAFLVIEPRILNTLIGSVLAFLVTRFLWPNWQYKNLFQLLNNAIRRNRDYLKAIRLDYRANLHVDDLNYQTARFEAHQAEKSLVMAWKGMHLEPKKKQKFMNQAFTLTYLNHALLSYLSALGSHRDESDYIGPIQLKYLQKIETELKTCMITNLDKQSIDSSSQNLHHMLEEINETLSQTEKGISRQKLSLLYNITEVCEQLLQEAKILSEE